MFQLAAPLRRQHHAIEPRQMLRISAIEFLDQLELVWFESGGQLAKWPTFNPILNRVRIRLSTMPAVRRETKTGATRVRPWWRGRGEATWLVLEQAVGQ